MKLPKSPQCERCHETSEHLKETTTGSGILMLCPTCRAGLYEYMQKCKRRNREFKRDRIKNELDRVIPPLYRQARLSHLSGKFKADLLIHRDAPGLALCGPVGTGKTYTVCALARTIIASGKSVERVNYPDLCLEIRDTFRRDATSSELTIIRQYVDADVTIVEDIGAGKDKDGPESEFSLRVLYVLLNKRLELMRQTIVTTNNPPKNLAARFDERIGSRLKYFKWVACGGSDMRKLLENV